MRLPGAPKPSYEMLLGLLLNGERQQLRRSYAVLRGTRDAAEEEVPKAYFGVIFDDPAMAEAEHAMHVSRVASQRREHRAEAPVDE